MASDDHEARSLGWPCPAAQATAIAMAMTLAHILKAIGAAIIVLGLIAIAFHIGLGLMWMIEHAATSKKPWPNDPTAYIFAWILAGGAILIAGGFIFFFASDLEGSQL